MYRSENYSDSIEIDYLSDDSNDLKTNTCFVCVEGYKYDSHKLVDNLLIEPSLIISNKQLYTNIPYVIVCDTKVVLSQISKNFYENPSDKLNIIATTGTDGKTTTSQIVKELIDQYSDCAYIGTNGFKNKYFEMGTQLTTPKPIYLNKYLKRCVNDGVSYIALEASSQGISEHRLDGIRVSRAIFTNLTHEHLDYHKTIEDYFNSKLKLFTNLDESAYAIVNADQGIFTDTILNETKAHVITYGTHEKAMFKIDNIKSSLYKTSFSLTTPDEQYDYLSINLFGDYNVYNVVAALAVLYSYGFDLSIAINKLPRLSKIDGRMNIIEEDKPFKVIVDFAHTPNALKSLLSNIKQIERKNKVILVFGSAGERDKTKRPIMGQIAESYCDKLIVTNEDPKSEEPLEIIHDIVKGIKNPFKAEIILDRKDAIRHALAYADKDDIVLITGKGNETKQVFKDHKIDHNDIDVTLEFLNNHNFTDQIDYLRA